MAKTVTVYIAAPGAQHRDGSPSRMGHTWFGLDRGDGSEPKSFGFGADTEGLSPIGDLRKNDTTPTNTWRKHTRGPLKSQTTSTTS